MRYYNNCYSNATNCDSIHNLSSHFHAKIATKLYKIISDTALCIDHIKICLYHKQ